MRRIAGLIFEKSHFVCTCRVQTCTEAQQRVVRFESPRMPHVFALFSTLFQNVRKCYFSNRNKKDVVLTMEHEMLIRFAFALSFHDEEWRENVIG